jgi:hypothetical protein
VQEAEAGAVRLPREIGDDIRFGEVEDLQRRGIRVRVGVRGWRVG